MQFFPVDLARMIIQRLRLTIVYQPADSRCPICGSKAPVRGTAGVVGTCTVRYHECSGCGATFKSLGPIDERVPQSGKSPETLTRDERGRHTKGKRR